MNKFLSFLFIILLSTSFLTSESFAKRFGGGRSFGVQRSQSSLFSSKATNPAANLGQRAKTNRWGGVLGGLLIGGLLASLFMGNGFFHGLLTWLVVGALIFFVVGFFRRRMQPGLNAAGAQQSFRQNSSFSDFTPAFNKPDMNVSSGSGGVYPQDFDSESFLREAKLSFIRLQAAYDQKNLEDLTAFTAPEVFGEIKMQLDERGDAPNKTEVIALHAELLDVSKQFDSTMASVRFTGSIKEEEDQQPTTLDEIWHFRQFGTNKNWVVGGIQQTSS